MTKEEFERVRMIARKNAEETNSGFILNDINFEDINEEEKVLTEKRKEIIDYLSKRQVFPYIDGGKLVFKKISYNFKDEFFKCLDESLGIIHSYIEEYCYKQESDYLPLSYGMDKISEKVLNYYELTEIISNDPKYKDNFNKLQTTYNKNRNITNYKFKLTTYMEHSKVYLIIKSMMDNFDLSQIYLSLCEFFEIEYSHNILDNETNSQLYIKKFNKKEKELDIKDKKKLLKFIFSKINANTVCEVKFSQRDEIADIYIDIATKNTVILNDETFKTIIDYIKDESSINKVKYITYRA